MLCMRERWNIKLDQEAYDRLRALKCPGDTFSDVIKREMLGYTSRVSAGQRTLGVNNRKRKHAKRRDS